MRERNGRPGDAVDEAEAHTRDPHDSLPLRTVTRLTGLSPDIIRAWERRYAVVAPTRGPRGARLYSASDVDHLRLLRRAVSSGRAIGDVARLSQSALEELIGSAIPEATRAAVVAAPGAGSVAPAIAALERFDRAALDRCLSDALVAFGARGFVERVAIPLLTEVGERWGDGRLSVADEHLLSGIMRNLLGGVLRSRQTSGHAGVLLATPSGERHEFGLMMAGLMIAESECDLWYLGVDLPAAEVAAAARRSGAAVVGMGVSNGTQLDASVAELRRIERELPTTVELWVGGREARAAVAQLGATRAVVVDQMTTLENDLARLRAQNVRRL
jgi:MerR family transcriptional regulator, light-induced transcriptional regulator